MDLMLEWEIYDMYDMLQYADTALWELTRWLMYTIALVNSRKLLKVTDILDFPWDGSTQKNTTISNEEIERLKIRAELIRKDLFNKE